MDSDSVLAQDNVYRQAVITEYLKAGNPPERCDVLFRGH